jgi:hypothetical protein
MFIDQLVSCQKIEKIGFKALHMGSCADNVEQGADSISLAFASKQIRKIGR